MNETRICSICDTTEIPAHWGWCEACQEILDAQGAYRAAASALSGCAPRDVEALEVIVNEAWVTLLRLQAR